MLDLSTGAYAVAGLSVILIGISKGGFGGGVGLIATPLLAMALPVQRTVGILLPLLLACDIAAIAYYRREFDRRSIKLMIPGTIVGVIIGSFFLGEFSDRWLKLGMGVLAVGFVSFEMIRTKVLKRIERFHPGPVSGSVCGACSGFSSTLAHAAGPFVTIYLLPQNLDRRTFVGTNAIFFAFLNGIKMIPYIALRAAAANGDGVYRIGLLEPITTASLLPFAPVGVALGIWLNRKIDETWFRRIVYILLFAMGTQLIMGRSLLTALLGSS